MNVLLFQNLTYDNADWERVFDYSFSRLHSRTKFLEIALKFLKFLNSFMSIRYKSLLRLCEILKYKVRIDQENSC